MARVLLLIIILIAAVVVRIDGLHNGDGGSGNMSICDSIDRSLCQLINYTTTIHIELTLSMDCDDEYIQNNIQCDIDEALSAALADITETSNTIMSCTTAVNDSGMYCRTMISALDNSTVSQTLTQQLFELLVTNRTLVMYRNISLVNTDFSTDDDDDDLILGLELWEVITILISIIFAAIGFCITFSLMIRAICRCARGKQQPTTKQVQSTIRNRSTRDATDHDLNYAVISKRSPDNVAITTNPSYDVAMTGNLAYGHNGTLETTNGPPLSPTTYEMETFYPAKKKNSNDQNISETVLTIQQLHDGIEDLQKLHEHFESLSNEPVSAPAEGTNESSPAPNTVTHSHVKLSSKYTSDELAPNDINANYIKGYNTVERCYIVTHGPHQDNINNFWQMVWEQKPVAIAMLQQRDESYIYWPDTSETLRQEFGLITVTVRKRITKPEYIVTTLRLFHAEENEEHIEVEHYWYIKWTADQLPTNTSGVIAFLQEINEKRKSSEGPLLVHCSDGLGCSGMLVTIDIARHQLENNRIVDITKIVNNIRQERIGMIVTKEQYVYIYQVLSDWTEDLLKLEMSMDAEKTASTDHLVP